MCHSSQWRVEGRWVPNDESMRPWEIETETEEADGISHGKFGSSGPENTVGKPVRDSYSESVVHSQYQQAPVMKQHNFWSLGKWFNKQKFIKDEIAREWMKGNTNEQGQGQGQHSKH
ncbi:unnamed protein product [Ambrosiozyma monospora]|uniref:Unnamed protein product n=1 Tax=Ambrosiozyma monospora TaxID=43982 RepID=A0ACB5UCS5_AMBMO|nr:unnamed protein product [Ambrosiozyma monospora]